MALRDIEIIENKLCTIDDEELRQAIVSLLNESTRLKGELILIASELKTIRETCEKHGA